MDCITTKTISTLYVFDQLDGGSDEVVGEEDCLMMNIYSPNLTPDVPYPVMVCNLAKGTASTFTLHF